VKAFHVSEYSVFTGFFNAIGLNSGNRSGPEQFEEKSEFLARSTYGNWFAQELVCRPVVQTASGRSRIRDDLR